MRNMFRRLRLNRVIVLLTVSDIFTWGIYYILSSLGAIYVAEKLGENVVGFVAIGNGIYLITRAIVQIPIGLLTDHLKNDHDEILLLCLGNILMGSAYMIYPSISEHTLYFGAQFIFGLGTALNLVTWRKLFSQNLDKQKEGMQYALYDTINSLVAALFSVLAVVASVNKTYFDMVMYGFGIVMIISCIWPLLIYFVRKRKSRYN